MNRKINVGILSDSPFLTTGYSTISSNIANILAENGMNVYYFGSNYIGQNLVPGSKFEDGRILNFNIIGQGREAYFKDLLPTYVKQFNIDVLFILLDSFMTYPWIMELDLSPSKVIFYFPSDGGSGMPIDCERILRFVHCPVAMAMFGQKQVKDMYGLDTKYIPHAVDIKNYYSMSDIEKNELKQRWGLQGRYVVGCVARNQGRKMMDRVIKTFALYYKYDTQAVLLLHTDPYDNAQVFPLLSLIHRYGIANRVMFTGTKFFNGFTYKQMNEIYNLMDVFLLTTSGEGFGVPIIEAMACKIPVVCTDYTTTRELVVRNKAGLAIKLVGTEDNENPDVHCNEILDGTITGSWSVERGIPSIKDACEKLKQLKDNPELRKEMGMNGRQAVMKEYNWDVVGKQWIDLIKFLGEKI